MENKELDQLLSMAIFREIEAHNFYLGASEKVSDNKVKDLFLELAKQEKDHEHILERYRDNPDLASRLKPTKDYKVAESEDLPELSLDMKPHEAVRLAMKKEQQAAEFYDWLADNTEDDESSAMCKNLSRMERNHKHLLENLFVNMAFPEVW